MNGKGKSRRPMRRGGAQGRAPSRRETPGGTGRPREDREDKNWTKKLEEGELDDLLVTGEGDDDEDWFEDEEDDDEASG